MYTTTSEKLTLALQTKTGTWLERAKSCITANPDAFDENNEADNIIKLLTEIEQTEKNNEKQ